MPWWTEYAYVFYLDEPNPGLVMSKREFERLVMGWRGRRRDLMEPPPGLPPPGLE